MAGFERSPFGDNVTNTTSNVSNHYGPREVGGEKGGFQSAGPERTAGVNFDISGPIYDEIEIPANAIVTDVRGYDLTGAIATATVGAQDISAARDDDDATWVTITTAGVLAVTGPTAGNVLVKWRAVA